MPAETNLHSPMEPYASPHAPANETALWRALHLNIDDRKAKESLLELYLPLVKAELGRICYHLPPHVDRQELYADGIVGLLSAITNFEPAQGVVFVAYARKRIWGAMMDRVRGLDGIPRSVRKSARRMSRAIQGFLNKHGRQPDESELAAELEVNLDELHELERQAGLAQTLSLDVGGDSDESHLSGTLGDQLEDQSSTHHHPLDRLANDEMRALLVEGLKALPDRERGILVLYYQQGLMLKEIAEAMDISESRVSQLHNRALLRLRAHMEKEDPSLAAPAPFKPASAPLTPQERACTELGKKKNRISERTPETLKEPKAAKTSDELSAWPSKQDQASGEPQTKNAAPQPQQQEQPQPRGSSGGAPSQPGRPM